MISEPAKAASVATPACTPVSSSSPFTFTVRLRGDGYKPVVEWEHNCPARLHNAFVAIYEGKFPEHADQHSDWTWAEHSKGSHKFEKAHWGPGWGAALCAQDGTGKKVYVVKTAITGT